MVFPGIILRINKNAAWSISEINLCRPSTLLQFILGQVIYGRCSFAHFKPLHPWGTKLQPINVQVWCLAQQTALWASREQPLALLPEHERWARASRVWRSLCNRSWCPQNDETRLLLVLILHLLLIQTECHTISVRTDWMCMSRTLAEEWKSPCFPGLPLLKAFDTAQCDCKLWFLEATPWKTLILSYKHLFPSSFVYQSSSCPLCLGDALLLTQEVCENVKGKSVLLSNLFQNRDL